MKKLLWSLLATVTVAATMQAQSDTRPGVAILPFTVSIAGPGGEDYESLGLGVAALLSTDLVNSANVRVVDREQLNALLREQDLSSTGRISAETAVRLGKLVGARYMLVGDVTSIDMDPKTRMPRNISVAIRTIDSETGELKNLGDRLRGAPDDVASLVSRGIDAAVRDLKLPALPAGPARDAGEVAKATAKKAPFQTVMLYSRALEAQDKGNKAEAVTLFKQALDKFPEHEPSKVALKKLGATP
jgi:hypothetical protein